MARPGIAHQPALDGLRALAVAVVLLFHADVPGFGGGYLGVSVFFTLSGFLITSLLIAEQSGTGTVGVGAFYVRRAKRLLPASLACIGLITLAALATDWFDAVTTLRRDLLGATLQVANWVSLAGGGSYQELLARSAGQASPVEHYWSLAIEEQFYWVWPLVMLVVLGRIRTATGRLRFLVAMAVIAAIAAPVIAAVWGADAAYWSTPARAGEILVGAAVAAALNRYQARPGLSLPLVAIGLAAIGWAAVTWPTFGGPAYAGWFPVFALATAAVIVGVQHHSPVRRGMSWRPLVWTGGISYGLYLYHWPLFAALSESRLGIGGVALFVVQMSATFALATVSARLVERPVRAWSPPPLRPLVGAVAATAAVAVGVVVIVEPTATTAVDLTAAAIAPVEGTLAELALAAPPSTLSMPSPAAPVGGAASGSTGSTGPSGSTGSMGPSGSTSTLGPNDGASPRSTDVGSAAKPIVPVAVPAPSRPARIVVVGDSTAQAVSIGLVEWATQHPDVARVTVAASPGCGFMRSGQVPSENTVDFDGECDRVLDERLPAMARDLQPDAALMMVTMRDVEDRVWYADEGVLSPFDDRFRERMLADYRAIADTLLMAGIDRLVWVLAPRPLVPFEGEQRKMRNPARYAVQHGVIEQVARERAGAITVLDLNSWLTEVGLVEDVGIRPDGIHISPEAALWLSEVYLAGSVVSAAIA